MPYCTFYNMKVKFHDHDDVFPVFKGIETLLLIVLKWFNLRLLVLALNPFYLVLKIDSKMYIFRLYKSR